MRHLLLVWALGALLSAGAIAQGNPTITFNTTEHDAGKTYKDNAPVHFQYVFHNTGNIPISILRVETDCACITSFYTTTPIYPGETGKVKVSFDPIRPGPYEKKFTVITDAYPRTHELALKGYIMPSASEDLLSMFVYQNGNFRFRYKNLNLGSIKNTATVSKKFEMLNTSKEKITFTKKILAPPHIKVYFDSSNVIEPGKTGAIVVTYNPKERGSSGYFQDNITMFTTDAAQPKLEMNLIVNVQEADPDVNAPVASPGPRIRISEVEQSLGDIYLGVSVVTEFVLQNEGSATLETVIRAEADCEILSDRTMSVAPQDFAVIQVRFKHNGQTGKQTRRFTIQTNDPARQSIPVQLTANVIGQ
jgi:Protein of unknown function (DUF1573)